VRDHVQLRFDGPCLSAYSRPEVTIGPEGKTVTLGESYAGAMVALIGRSVVAADSSDDSIQLKFDNDSVLSVSLRPEHYRAAEAATLVLEGDKIWSW